MKIIIIVPHVQTTEATNPESKKKIENTHMAKTCSHIQQMKLHVPWKEGGFFFEQCVSHHHHHVSLSSLSHLSLSHYKTHKKKHPCTSHKHTQTHITHKHITHTSHTMVCGKKKESWQIFWNDNNNNNKTKQNSK